MSRRPSGQSMKTEHHGIEVGSPRRFAVIAVSLGITVLSTSFVIAVFATGRVSERSRAMTSAGPVGDGSICFRAENDQGESVSGIVETDGTGRHEAFPGDRSTQFELSSSNGGTDFDPRWSPDGTQIVFGGSHDEDWGVFEVRRTGATSGPCSSGSAPTPSFRAGRRTGAGSPSAGTSGTTEGINPSTRWNLTVRGSRSSRISRTVGVSARSCGCRSRRSCRSRTRSS